MKIVFDRSELVTKAKAIQLMPMTLAGWAYVGQELLKEKFHMDIFKVCHVNLTEKGRIKNVQITV